MSNLSDNENTALYALNIVSLIAASLVLILFIFASIVKPKLVKRVTLRLQTGSAATDIILHINNLIEVKNDYCEAIGFFRYYTRLAYCFINISIALNLQLIFIHEREPNNKWEIIYWVVSIFLALVLNIPQIYFDYKGDELKRDLCKDSFVDEAIGVFYSSIMISTFLYCLIVSVLVLLRLRKDWTSLVKSTFNQMDQSRKRMKWLQRELKGLALRVVLYPVVAFIVLSGLTISQFDFAFKGSESLLQSWSMIGQNLSGLLDFVAICFDPSLQYCYITIFKDLRDKFLKRTLIKEPPNINRNSQRVETNDMEPTYFSDNEFTINSETSTEESYQCIMFDDDQCRQAVEMF